MKWCFPVFQLRPQKHIILHYLRYELSSVSSNPLLEFIRDKFIILRVTNMQINQVLIINIEFWTIMSLTSINICLHIQCFPDAPGSIHHLGRNAQKADQFYNQDMFVYINTKKYIINLKWAESVSFAYQLSTEWHNLFYYGYSTVSIILIKLIYSIYNYFIYLITLLFVLYQEVHFWVYINSLANLTKYYATLNSSHILFLRPRIK